MEKMVNNSYFDSIVKLIQQNSVLPKFCIDKCGIDLRHIIKGLKRPFKRFVHRDISQNQHCTFF